MKYHLIKWKIICRPEEKRGLGIEDLEKMNTSLLSNGGGNWKIKKEAKYVRNKPIALVESRQGDFMLD
jgi:hypothetical protein